MDVKKYIASGVLELYVAGSLSEEENIEVYRNAQEYPEIRKEIEAIESTILSLSKMSSPGISFTKGFHDIRRRTGLYREPITREASERKWDWRAYSGWAAALLFAAGTLWFYLDGKQMKIEMNIVAKENSVLEQQIFEARNTIANSKALLNTIRSKDITVIPLGGQDISPTSYAKAYWNKETQQVFIDAIGLPEPPDGMVYQVWSLKLNPLTPTSIGLLEDFTSDENKIFAVTNLNESEAFGITLEPAGGSESPTLEQLYALGTIPS